MGNTLDVLDGTWGGSEVWVSFESSRAGAFYANNSHSLQAQKQFDRWYRMIKLQ